MNRFSFWNGCEFSSPPGLPNGLEVANERPPEVSPMAKGDRPNTCQTASSAEGRGVEDGRSESSGFAGDFGDLGESNSDESDVQPMSV